MRQTDRQRARERERDRDRQTDKETERETERDGQRERERERERERRIKRQREIHREPTSCALRGRPGIRSQAKIVCGGGGGGGVKAVVHVEDVEQRRVHIVGGGELERVALEEHPEIGRALPRRHTHARSERSVCLSKCVCGTEEGGGGQGCVVGGTKTTQACLSD